LRNFLKTKEIGIREYSGSTQPCLVGDEGSAVVQVCLSGSDLQDLLNGTESVSDFTDWQLCGLMKAFDAKNYLNDSEFESLSRLLRRDVSQLKDWFRAERKNRGIDQG
jgi:hypothetical protein